MESLPGIFMYPPASRKVLHAYRVPSLQAFRITHSSVVPFLLLTLKDRLQKNPHIFVGFLQPGSKVTQAGGFLRVSWTWLSVSGSLRMHRYQFIPSGVASPSVLLIPEPCQCEAQWSGSSCPPPLGPSSPGGFVWSPLSLLSASATECCQVSCKKHLGKESRWKRFSWQVQNTSTVRSY